MADPEIIACPTGAWTKVATNVFSGQIHRLEKRARYYQTYRQTGEAAPDPEVDAIEKIPVFVTGDTAKIESPEPVDVYIYVSGDVAANVRADL